ncbi:hypothetical protein DH2020_045799 [Rehmannia glutinosa]|uniref:Protein kinase domain-containing protein n=1 Tax=Rehmannia glutinosa TaxID=99300 RepID=A0ABR0UDR3_REHGL
MAHWLFFFIFFYFTINPATCSNNETDLLALLAFKDNVIDPRGALDLWNLSNETVDFCSWKGISCGNKHRNRVVSINLDSQGLVGSISPHLGNLSFLRSISLRNNGFHGLIPQELGRLRRLGYIEFSNNSFSGEIPKNLSQCRNLHYLNLMDNELTGIIPHEISSLIKLYALGLSDNDFSGNNIPPIFGNFTSLIELSLSNCGLHGYIPESLVHLRKLKRLILDTNKLTGKIPSGIYNISTLEIFAVFTNQLQGDIPSYIGSTLPNLRNLGLGDNNFSGVLPVSLSNASSLQYVGLFASSFTGPMPKNLGRLLDLRFLSIWSTNVEDDIGFISSLTNCTRLTVVDIFDNMLTGSLPSTITNLTTQLRKLTIGINRIHGTIPPDLSVNNFSGVIPREIMSISSLSIYLDLSYNALFGSVPSEVGLLRDLSDLDLSHNRLSGIFPNTISGCISLQRLHLDGNSFIGEIPQGLSVLRGLQDLDLSRNNFSGLIPSFLDELHLLNLNLSFNRLQGPVPLDGVFETRVQFHYKFKKLSYADLLKATDGFSEANVIGSGRFSTVYKGVLEDGPSETVVAVKFKANGSLENWLHLNENMDRYLTLMQRLNIAIDVACAVEYLHSGTGSDIIVHGDLKPSNILLDDDMTAHVGDFGLAKVMSNIPSGFAAGESSSIADLQLGDHWLYCTSI